MTRFDFGTGDSGGSGSSGGTFDGDMQGSKIINLAPGTEPNDATNKSQLDLKVDETTYEIDKANQLAKDNGQDAEITQIKTDILDIEAANVEQDVEIADIKAHNVEQDTLIAALQSVIGAKKNLGWTLVPPTTTGSAQGDFYWEGTDPNAIGAYIWDVASAQWVHVSLGGNFDTSIFYTKTEIDAMVAQINASIVLKADKTYVDEQNAAQNVNITNNTNAIANKLQHIPIPVADMNLLLTPGFFHYGGGIANVPVANTAGLIEVKNYDPGYAYQCVDVISGNTIVSKWERGTSDNGVTWSEWVTREVVLTQSEYDAIATKNPTVLYLIRE